MTSVNPPRTVAVSFGLIFALSGFIHGWFEALQGPHPVPGRFIEAIGPAHRYWIHGQEGAFTLLPDFLSAGLVSMALAVAVAAWSLTRIHLHRGPAVFLGLMIALTLTGGGIGHIAFYLPAWGWMTRIPAPVAPWQRRLADRRSLVALWRPALGLAILCWLIAQYISVAGHVPGLSDPDAILAVCWSFLGATLVLLNIAFPLALAARAAQP